MSTSRSRSNTSGAFGNHKPKPMGFHPAPARLRRPDGAHFSFQGDPELNSKWGAFTVASKLLPADAMETRVNAEQELERRKIIQGAANISRLIWNAAILGKKGEDDAFQTISRLEDPVTKQPVAPPAEEIRQLIAELVALKKAMFPDYNKVVLNFECAFVDGQYRFAANGPVVDPAATQRPEGSVL